jgi:hypothetical protein
VVVVLVVVEVSPDTEVVVVLSVVVVEPSEDVVVEPSVEVVVEPSEELVVDVEVVEVTVEVEMVDPYENQVLLY